MIQICFIREDYFLIHPTYIKMLDAGKSAKQSRRAHLCLKIPIDTNHFFVPLRNHLGKPVRPYGRIGHAVPSQKRPDAGLDFRYTIVVNNSSFVEFPDVQKIPNAQLHRIAADYPQIEIEFSKYLCGFRRAVRKKRIKYEPLYRESSLINFCAELEIKSP